MEKIKGKIQKKQIGEILLKTWIVTAMIFSVFPFTMSVHAEDQFAQITLHDRTDDDQRLEVSQVEPDIQKITLVKDGTILDTKEIQNPVNFQVFSNGSYDLVGYDEQDQVIGIQTVSVQNFPLLTAKEDTATHQIRILSRQKGASLMISSDAGKQKPELTEIYTGVWQALYQPKDNGIYTCSIVDQNGQTIQTVKVNVSDIQKRTDAGAVIIRDEADLQQIVEHPSGQYVLEKDITIHDHSLANVDFSGILDGQGYTLDGFDTLFHTAQNAVIKNVMVMGQLAQSSMNTTIANCGFYVSGEDIEKDYAPILKSEHTDISGSFSFMNVEGKHAAGFVLEGTGDITDSYVSGYLKAEEGYGFGKQVNVHNSYITASLQGKKRELFTEGKLENAFYDAQINTLEDDRATPYYTADLLSENLDHEGFLKTDGQYPQIKDIREFKEKAQKASALSVTAVTANSNLSAFQEDVSLPQTKPFEWQKSKREIRAVSDQMVNRFALKKAKTIASAEAGEPTTSTTTQIIYPVVMGRYYKIMKSNEPEPALVTTHEEAINEGWKLMYWTGTDTASDLSWNREYQIYSTDLHTVTKEQTLSTKKGKICGKLSMSGRFDVHAPITATLTQTNTNKGTMIWETADTLNKDAVWSNVHQTTLTGESTQDTYTIQDGDQGKYLRVRFVADADSEYGGELQGDAAMMITRPIQGVTIQNKTSGSASMTIHDQLIASIEPFGKEQAVTFTWYQAGNDQAVGTGRNYTIRAGDIGKRLYVQAAAKDGSELNGTKDSELTAPVQTIKCATPTIANLREITHDDITVTLTMDADEGLYQFGYADAEGGAITPYDTLARASTKLTMTGLTAQTTYYLYVRQIGENGYADSDWSSAPRAITTDAPHVTGNVIIDGKPVFNETLQARIENKPAEQKGAFVWYRLDDHENRIESSKAVGDTYTLNQDDIGHKIAAVFQGKDGYAGEVVAISDSIEKAEAAAPTLNATIQATADTTIQVKMPINSANDRYIIGLSTTRDGVPIEQAENGQIKTLASGETYTIQHVERDTTYYVSIRYAASATHHKSPWIASDQAIVTTTVNTPYSGTLTFTYEHANQTLVKGQTVTAVLPDGDSDFKNQGTWTWTKKVNGQSTPIYDFSISQDRHSTCYMVPTDEETGTVYEVSFTATAGYEGTVTGTTAVVQSPIKAPYAKPDVNSLVMEPIHDGGIKVRMTAGEGQYQFFYKEENTVSPAFGALTMFTESDGYTKADPAVAANVDLVIEGLKRNTTYIIKVQRIEDAKGAASDYGYSNEAATPYTSVTTKQTDIAGYVSLKGKEAYGETLHATYHPAAYASTGNGSDETGTWTWYREDMPIAGQNSDAYTLTQADIGKTVKAVYTMPENQPFTGSMSAPTNVIEKADYENPTFNNLNSEDIDDVLTLVVNHTIPSDENAYYRLQKASASAPAYPDTPALSANWTKVTNSTLSITEDADHQPLIVHGDYTLYMIVQENNIHKNSSMMTATYQMGTMKQTGTAVFSGDFVVGKTIKATLTTTNNTLGKWHWYMSKKRYSLDSITAMPNADETNWEEINSGFSPIMNTDHSSLTISEDMFAHYIKAVFVADPQQGYSGKITTDAAADHDTHYIKKVYEETISINSSTKDGYGKPKAYANTKITATVNQPAESGNIARDTVRFKIANTNGTNASYLTPSISGSTFTYTMPNNQSYDGKEITAEISKPKVTALYVDTNLHPLTQGLINSKSDTNTSVPYTAGIPISNANDMTNFLKKGSGYTNRSEKYVITSNINMRSSNIVPNNVTAAGTFYGTLDGDYHTLTEMKTYITASLNNGTIKNLIINNSKAATPTAAAATDGWQCATAVAAYTEGNAPRIERVFLTQSDLHGKYDGGGIVGKNNANRLYLNEAVSAGSTIRNEDRGAHYTGGMVGYSVTNLTVTNSYSINSTIVDPYVNSWLGGLVAGTGTSYSSNTILTNTYAAGKVPVSDKSGGLIGADQISRFNDPRTITNSYYDGDVAGVTYRFEQGKNANYIGKRLHTTDMIGTELQNAYGNNGTWTYKDGYYPILTWLKDHPIANLYGATRGAFTSIDQKTSSNDLFNGNLYGVIQVPAKFLSKGYTVKSSNTSILKIGANGTIIPVGNPGQKATITITYTEPDPTIGGSASNTYDFTVKTKTTAMSGATIQDEATGTALMDNPKMNQVLKADSLQGTSFQWYRRKTGTTENTLISGATNRTYTIKPSDIGYEIAVVAKASNYADTFSEYTTPVLSIQPDAPSVSEITDQSAVVKPTNATAGLTYEFGYVAAGENADKTIVDQTCQPDGAVTIQNLTRNQPYDIYVRIAAAKDGSYPAGEWSEAARIRLAKTPVSGTIQIGSAQNNGEVLTMQIEAVNGQSGTWKLERIAADSEAVEAPINDSSLTVQGNQCRYTLSGDDVGKRIKITFQGSGDYSGERTIITDVIKKTLVSAPSAPIEVTGAKAITSLTVTMNNPGQYDIGIAPSSSAPIVVKAKNVAANTDILIDGLQRHTNYYVYARTSSTAGSEASNWSAAAILTTAKEDVSGNLFVSGDLQTDSTIQVSAPMGQSGMWKLERVQPQGTTTIAPSQYHTDDALNTLQYQLMPNDAQANIKISFMGTGDYQGEIMLTTDTIANAKPDTSNMPSDIQVDNSKDDRATVFAKDGNQIYQFGYALQGEAAIQWNDVTASAGQPIVLSGLQRNSSYDIYVRKAKKKGYDVSDPIKMNTRVNTQKTKLNGTITYQMTDGTLQAGYAEVGKTYQAVYQTGNYDQPGIDTEGSWQWYANNQEIIGANSDTYTVDPMEGTVEISVAYIPSATGDFRNPIQKDIGFLYKPAYAAVSDLPNMSALAEDGTPGSKLEITASQYDHVFYYVQKAEVVTIPTLKTSSEVKNNAPQPDQWFAAGASLTMRAEPNTDYVLYAARLEDGAHRSSGIVSLRSVKTAKEDIDAFPNVQITEADQSEWKVLQDKELQISFDQHAVDGEWQYYVTKDKNLSASWQNITAELGTDVNEGKTAVNAYTRIKMPEKYNHYYMKIVFKAKGNDQGEKTYVTTNPLIGTKIKGSIQIESGDTSEVFTPIQVKYRYAKDDQGNDIVDEDQGIWKWYRETAPSSQHYEEIPRTEVHAGLSDVYVPTAQDVGKGIYAVYTGASDSIYSGSVRSAALQSVVRSVQNTPAGLQVRQVNGTQIEFVLPMNYQPNGKAIPDVVLSYREADDQGSWIVNDANDAWLGSGHKKLIANTTYEVRAKFSGTSEYLPSDASNTITVTTGNQSFHEDQLQIMAPTELVPNAKIKAVYSGPGYDEGNFVVRRSDGTLVSTALPQTVSGFTVQTTYTITDDDIGNNMIIQYVAKPQAQTYGGSIEKNTREVLKPKNPHHAGTPLMEIIPFQETRLKAAVDPQNEYVLNEQPDPVPSGSGAWQKRNADADGNAVFTGLNPNTSYYLHTRIAETPTYTISDESLSAPTKTWQNQMHTITYLNMEHAVNGDPVNPNPTQFNELSATIHLQDPSKDGYTFIGWTTDQVSEPTKNLTIPLHTVTDQVFTAHWRANPYTIDYELHGGSYPDQISNPTTYTIETNTFELNHPIKKGYRFTGWTWDGQPLPQLQVQIPLGTFGDRAYEAHWQLETYSINYHMQGGTNDPSNPSTYTMLSDTKVIQDPTKVGNTFLGWTWDGQSEPVKQPQINQGSTGEKTYTANWEKIKYTVTYVTSGGSTMPPSTVRYEETIPNQIGTQRPGYTLAGWYREPTLEHAWDMASDRVMGDVTLYAKWQINSYNAVFDLNGSDIGQSPTITKNYEEALGVLPLASRTGYTFKGWYSEQTGGDKITPETRMPLNGATYYAHWTICSYTATFDSHGGNGGGQISADYDTALGQLPTAQREGYTFDGWYSEQTGGDKITEATPIPAQNVMYYAHWKVNTYEVKLSGSGGSDASLIKNYGEALGELPQSKRKGYTFLGWFTAKTDGDKITADTAMPLDGATYYAHWKINQYAITFETGAGSAVPSLTTAFHQQVKKPNDPKRAYYVFDGWYQNPERKDAFDFTTLVEADTTLYAGWKPEVYSITYNLDDGTNATNNPLQYTVEDALTLHAPKRSGYTFIGWTYEGQSDPQMDVTLPRGTHGAIQFTAHWKANVLLTNGQNTKSTKPASKALPQNNKKHKQAETYMWWFLLLMVLIVCFCYGRKKYKQHHSQ